jgi:predicted DNA-binding transcriptional regulator AlpA
MARLVGKEEIMNYSGLKRSTLKDAIEKASFPHFYVGGKMCSSEEAIDQWFLVMAVENRGVSIGSDEDPAGGEKV